MLVFSSLCQELGAYPEDVFDAIDETPVAAASLGQVRGVNCTYSVAAVFLMMCPS